MRAPTRRLHRMRCFWTEYSQITRKAIPRKSRGATGCQPMTGYRLPIATQTARPDEHPRRDQHPPVPAAEVEQGEKGQREAQGEETGGVETEEPVPAEDERHDAHGEKCSRRDHEPGEPSPRAREEQEDETDHEEEDTQHARQDELARGDQLEVDEKEEHPAHDHGKTDEVGPPEEDSKPGLPLTLFHIPRRAPFGWFRSAHGAARILPR